VFEFHETFSLSQLRVTYGVNHRPGVIHAPRAMRLRFIGPAELQPPVLEVTDWDDTPDGRGIYEIQRRQKLIKFPTVEVRKVEIEWENDFEWTSLAEIEFNPPEFTESDAIAPAKPEVNSDDRHAVMAESSNLSTGFESVDRIRALVASAQIGTADEYRVIPEIWQHAIAAGRRNDAAELRAMLAASLPAALQPLEDWQSVVIGGGVINGISQAGVFPGPRIAEIIGSDADLSEKWLRSLVLATEMADHEPTPQGTRYDALRMLALRPWEDAQEPLTRYLRPGTAHELQMGAVSGLLDVTAGEAAVHLHQALGHLPDDLRQVALDGLTRPITINLLRAMLMEGKITPDALHPDIRLRLSEPSVR
jgi:hypothetical protein